MEQREVFDRMAPGWYSRRHWTIFRRELEELASRWQKGRLLNVGCGHGADFLPFIKRFELHGLDISVEMLRFARRYAAKFGFQPLLAQGDAQRLPYQTTSFDWAIAVATYHHIDTLAGRRQAFMELRRVLKPGGEAFVTLWNHRQPGFWGKPKEMMISWKTKEAELRRYYYLFSHGEAERAVREAGFSIIRSGTEAAYRLPWKMFSRNICLLLRRID